MAKRALIEPSSHEPDREPRDQFAALPWRRRGDGGVQVLLITSRETRRWVIPKGWGKKKETGAEAAAREALEECGVSGRVATKPVGGFRYQKILKTGEPQAVRVAVHALEVIDELEDWPERAIREKLWVSPQHASRLVDEPDLKALLLEFDPDRAA